MNRVRKGDKKAFEELFHFYYPGLCTYAESLVKSPEQAEEIVQEVFFNVWKNRLELNILVSWQRYLYRSVFNQSMMQLRRLKREGRMDDQVEAKMTSSTGNPSEMLEASELNAILVYTLQGLPERTSIIFKMNRFEGLKYKEIANQLGISIKTVEANMGKALKALRISLDEFRKTA